jgi:hypothetical protein
MNSADQGQVWRRHDVDGSWDDAICFALLTEPPCSFVVITEEDDPNTGGERYCLLVPTWGTA